ncbi:unnamed protein product [Linum tenue]|uniref:Uncharacterized protein n=1 Tax=Linum tenue TaxID=586396 RepID=A0AAV0RFZ0_9ROSI|nr:unnamed protein product [Linum tenue]
MTREACYGGDSWSSTVPCQLFFVRICKLADHGSISFGGYESESLAWEKFSVFSRKRPKKDVEKSTAPGFVAQKKAYFEEYFKGFRAMKGLFKRESRIDSRRAGKVNGVTKWGSCSSSSYTVPIQVLKNEDSADLVSNHNVSTMMGDECGNGERQSQADSSSISNPGTVRKDRLKCSKNGNRAKQGKKQISAKGSVASIASIVKLSTDLGKRSGGLKPSVSRSVTKKTVKEINPAQASTSTKSNHASSGKKLGEVQKSTASGVHVKSTREKMVSPAKSENSLVKPNVTSTSSGRLPVSAQNTKGIAITGHQKRPSLSNRLFTTVRDSLGLTYDVSFELSLFDRLHLGWYMGAVTLTPSKNISCIKDLNWLYEAGHVGMSKFVTTSIGIVRDMAIGKIKTTEKAYHATVEQAIDRRTRMVLFKMLNRGVLNDLNGCISTGKELLWERRRKPKMMDSGYQCQEGEGV